MLNQLIFSCGQCEQVESFIWTKLAAGKCPVPFYMSSFTKYSLTTFPCGILVSCSISQKGYIFNFSNHTNNWIVEYNNWLPKCGFFCLAVRLTALQKWQSKVPLIHRELKGATSSLKYIHMLTALNLSPQQTKNYQCVTEICEKASDHQLERIPTA